MTGHRKGETRARLLESRELTTNARLGRRLMASLKHSQPRPTHLFPSALATDANLEASTVHPQRGRDLRALLKPHVAATVRLRRAQ